MADEKPMLVRMPADLHALVAAAAKREDRSMAAVAREALRQYVAPKPSLEKPRTERVNKAKAIAAGVPAAAFKCQHLRRIGDGCPDCGATLK